MSDSDSENALFEIEKILAEKTIFQDGKVQKSYRVKWKGYDEDESTWEPESNFDPSSTVLITNFKLNNKFRKLNSRAR